MSNFNNYKKFENVGTRSSNETLIIMNSSNNNISLHSSDGGDDNVDTLSIKNIINKTPNMDLNLSSLTGTVINPVITINNTHSDCRIKTNLNVYGNVNINNNLIIPTHSETSNLLANIQGSIYYNTTENMYEGYSNEGWISLSGFSKTKDATIHKNLNVGGNINLTNGEMIQTSGIGSFGSINSGVGTFKNLNISGNLNLPVGITSSRPSNPSLGTIRYNSETHKFEGYANKWVNFISIVELYDFTSFTFTNCGATGRDGPTVINCRASYTDTWTDNDSYFSVVNGIQYWTVPKSGNYTIKSYGADALARLGGKGAIITGTFTLTSGEIIRILVGQRPEPYSSGSPWNSAGAGGTFVVRTPYNTNDSILVIAGGGGGGSGPRDNYTASIHGQAGSSGADGMPATDATSGAGGTNGNAGTSPYGMHGAGFFGQSSASDVAVSFTNSTTPGRGGMSVGGEGIDEEGGFGGGGKESGNGGGGGGGYSGGGGAGNSSPYSGGGGGSYNNGSNKNALTGASDGWEGQGKVVITFIS